MTDFEIVRRSILTTLKVDGDVEALDRIEAEVERLRATPNRENPELRQRMVGLAKAIDEEMQPGAREFALAAVSDFIDERDALYRKQDELEAEVERLRAENRRLRTELDDQRTKRHDAELEVEQLVKEALEKT
jgi:hypothetical protein